MTISILTLSILIIAVNGFTPTQPSSQPTKAAKNGKTVRVVAPDSAPIQANRNNNVSLHAMFESGVDPMISTVILGAVLLGTMTAYEDGEYTAVSNSAKSLVAEKKELEESVEAAVAEANEAADFEIEELKKNIENGEEEEAKGDDEKAKATVEPVKEEEKAPLIPEVIDVEAERKKLARIFGVSHTIKSVDLPPISEIEDTEASKPFLVKAVVKAFMPWKKFDNISGPTPTVAKLVAKTIMPWKKISNI